MKSIIKSIASLKLFFDLPDSIFAISSVKSSASYITFNGICTGVQNRSVSISPPLFASSGFFTSSIMFLFKLAIYILLLIFTYLVTYLYDYLCVQSMLYNTLHLTQTLYSYD